MKRLLFFSIVLFPLVVSAQWEYRGAIGNDLKIWMRLETYADTAFGAYFYSSNGEEIKLYGNRKNRSYKLREVNKDGKVTARLEFKEVDPYIRNEGTWIPVDKKKKKLPIKMFMLPPNISVAGSGPEPLYIFTDSIKRSSKQYRYEIGAYFPQFRFEDGYGMAQFNALTASFVRTEVENFANEFKDPGTDMPWVDKSMKSEMSLNYAILDTPGFISVEFKQYMYHLGAAHPFEATKTKTYSGRLHRWINLVDLFRPSDNYIGVLSRKCQDTIIHILRERARAGYIENNDTVDMKRKLAEIDTAYAEWIETGAGPKEKNFRSFTTSQEGIRIYFDPYQVASYADGPFEIFIPFRELQQNLAPDWEVNRWKRY
jgi:hypothetical protein